MGAIKILKFKSRLRININYLIEFIFRPSEFGCLTDNLYSITENQAEEAEAKKEKTMKTFNVYFWQFNWQRRQTV